MKSLMFGELQFIKELPAADSIADINITGTPGCKIINPEDFRNWFSTASAILPANTDDWHYSPFCSGSFSCNNEKYTFSLFLGGRGLLILPNGEKGLFSFQLKITE
ncbi:MAG: hypothetical protein JW864_18360 [Spirochaetes bacterium]|nr:hypothetical protein [Spirochaetota bacterium]